MGTIPVKTKMLQATTSRSHRDSDEVISWQLGRVRQQWSRYQSCRYRNAVCLYLEAVFDTVMGWKPDAKKYSIAAPASQGLPATGQGQPFEAVIRCTADPSKVDARTRSKWSRALRFADRHKKPPESLGEFIRAKGGINACAASWSGR